MNFYQKWIDWFKNQSRLIQVTIIVVACVLLIAGIWLSSMNVPTESTAATVDSTAWIVSVFLKMLLVILLIVGLAIVARKWMLAPGITSSKQLKVLETLSLTPKRSIHVVRWNEQVFMIGATDQNISLLSELDPSETGAAFHAALEKEILRPDQVMA
jgi:flagellar biosynthetic protein FliO